ncbi:MAG: DNA cytosine methyltransferase, partial [Muribaculaceae bacterium]
MKLVSLFSGCGGLDYGFEKAGYDVIWANEIDKTISSTYKLNHKNTVLETRDIRELLNSDIPDCDGIIGGPPCQSWSEGGKGRGIDDERGRLFLDYIRIVCDKKPKFFLIENVKGILEDKHSEAFNMFLGKLSEADYDVTYALVNCADYKIPQDRFRVFIMGIQNRYSKYYLFPNPVESEKVTLKEAIGDISTEPTK